MDIVLTIIVAGIIATAVSAPMIYRATHTTINHKGDNQND